MNGTWGMRWRELPLAAALGLGVHVIAYYLGNHFPSREAAELPMTAIDRGVPFLPWTVFIYLSDYILVIGTFFLCRSRTSALRFFCAQMCVIGVATFLHWAIPIAFPRELYPLPADTGALSAFALDLVRSIDAPTSCMPSLHVADSVLAPLMIRRDRPKAFPWLLAWSAAVAVSTLTTKQHYFVDVLAGVGLAVVTALVAGITFQPRPRIRPTAGQATT